MSTRTIVENALERRLSLRRDEFLLPENEIDRISGKGVGIRQVATDPHGRGDDFFPLGGWDGD